MTVAAPSTARKAAVASPRTHKSVSRDLRLAASLNGEIQRVPLTVEQYHRMIETGILPEGEPIELLGGILVRKDRSAAGEDPMTVGHDHVLVVKKLARLDRKLGRFRCHMQTQQPLTIPNHDEPEPDGAIVLGEPEDYVGRLPGPSDVTCVIEVADSSLRRDRTTKLAMYADSSIPQYIIINLSDRVIEVYSHPAAGKGRYEEWTTLRVGQNLEFLTPKTAAKTGNRLTVPVRSLLP